jgi:hypothetical protein
VAPAASRSSASAVRSTVSDITGLAAGATHPHDRLTTGIPPSASRASRPAGGSVHGATTAATTLASATVASTCRAASSASRPSLTGTTVSGSPVPITA